jgi:hypothetical protein
LQPAPADNLRSSSVIRCADMNLRPDACDAVPAARPEHDHGRTDCHALGACRATAGLFNRKKSVNQPGTQAFRPD